MGNEKMERTRGIANLIQELLRGVQNYTFGVSLTLKVAKFQNTLIEQSTTLIEHPSLNYNFQEVTRV